MSNKTVDMLNKALESEHAAIIQYLTHAYAMGECVIACEIEAIAREEMRHFDWLAEAILDLGGVPSIERGEMRLETREVVDWMRDDVQQEEEAVAMYERYIKEIRDSRIRRLLRRILSDEKAHHDQFAHLMEESGEEGLKDMRDFRQDRVAQILELGIAYEYAAVLQYLFQSYMTSDVNIKKELEDQAINQMQHLGWIAEKLVDCGGSPELNHARVDQSTAVVDMLKVDAKLTRVLAREYEVAAVEVMDGSVAGLLNRVKEQELYQSEVFNELLEGEEV